MNSLLRIAVKNAENSQHTFKIGAVAFKGGNIICSATNKTKTDPIRCRHKPKINKLHAEMSLCKQDITGSNVLVIRISRETGELTMAKPCNDCLSYLRESGVRKIIYTDFEGNLIRERI